MITFVQNTIIVTASIIPRTLFYCQNLNKRNHHPNKNFSPFILFSKILFFVKSKLSFRTILSMIRY